MPLNTNKQTNLLALITPVLTKLECTYGTVKIHKTGSPL